MNIDGSVNTNRFRSTLDDIKKKWIKTVSYPVCTFSLFFSRSETNPSTYIDFLCDREKRKQHRKVIKKGSISNEKKEIAEVKLFIHYL
jgi:ERCC4-type nuclease